MTSTNLSRTAVHLSLLALAVACSDTAGPRAEEPVGVATVIDPEPSFAVDGPATFSFRMLDRCDPASFNATFGPGTCIGDGKVTVAEFFAELEKKQIHHQWRNQPTKVALKAGRSLSVANVGGEVHTFTPVAEFGGGFIPELNAVTGNPVPAPECLDFGSIDFVPAGGVASLGELSEGTHRFMCCIHPWMRTTATVHH